MPVFPSLSNYISHVVELELDRHGINGRRHTRTHSRGEPDANHVTIPAHLKLIDHSEPLAHKPGVDGGT